MFLFKSKKEKNQKSQTEKEKECKAENGDSCPMCHVGQDIIDQLKSSDNQDKKEDKNCC